MKFFKSIGSEAWVMIAIIAFSSVTGATIFYQRVTDNQTMLVTKFDNLEKRVNELHTNLESLTKTLAVDQEKYQAGDNIIKSEMNLRFDSQNSQIKEVKEEVNTLRKDINEKLDLMNSSVNNISKEVHSIFIELLESKNNVR